MVDPSKSQLPVIVRLRSELATYWPLVLACVLLCAVDLTNRLMAGGDYPRTLGDRDNLATLSVTEVLDRSLYMVYVTKLSDYSDSLIKVPPESSGELTAQSGGMGADDEPMAWRTAKHSYRLMAIFTAGERFAVLKRTRNDTAVTELIEARVGDTLDGFVVGSMTVRGLLVTDADGDTAELRLFEPLSVDNADDGRYL